MTRRSTALLLVSGLICMAGLFAASQAGSILRLIHALDERSPQEWLRYLERRLEGHPKLESLGLPLIQMVRPHWERPIPELSFPTLGKGQQAQPVHPARQAAVNVLYVSSADDLRQALQSAREGTRIELAPGHYRFNQTLNLGHAGTAALPIVVWSPIPGAAILHFAQTEGILVDQPYWQFENLHIQGTCLHDDDCEHALHVVGAAHHFLLDNSQLDGFNAPIKINGIDDIYPDDGRITFTTLQNSRGRDTANPVVAIDLVGARRWRIEDSLISNFVKLGGNQISYAAFMKGGGSEGRFERNLVLCSTAAISQPGMRIGLSFGGGLTGNSYCRAHSCSAAEHSQGVMLNNIIAHCNDYGIDINQAAQAWIGFNTLINTGGIDTRGDPSSATLYGNLLDGGIKVRGPSRVDARDNQQIRLDHLFTAPDRLDLTRRAEPMAIDTPASVHDDFCHRARPARSSAGALDLVSQCTSARQLQSATQSTK